MSKKICSRDVIICGSFFFKMKRNAVLDKIDFTKKLNINQKIKFQTIICNSKLKTFSDTLN